MSEMDEEKERRFFFPRHHFRNQKPFSILQFFFCTTGAFLIILVGGSTFSDPHYCDTLLDCTGSSLLGNKVRGLAKYSPISIPYFWAVWPAYFWSAISFSFITIRNFNPQRDIVLNPSVDLVLRKHIKYFFFMGIACCTFLFTPIEVIEDRPIEFAAMSYYPIILFFGTGGAVLAAFPIVFFCMLAKVFVMRRLTLD